MYKPIFIVTIGFINGILIGIYFNKSISFFVVLLIIIAIIRFIFLNKKNKNNKENKKLNKHKYIRFFNMFIMYLIFLVIGSIFTNFKNTNYEEKYKEYDSKEVSVVGTIVSNIIEKKNSYECNIKVEKINNRKTSNDKFILYIKKGNNKNLELQCGNKIKIDAIYNEREIKRNYRGFDYKEYLKTKQIYGILNSSNLSKAKIIKKK